MRGPHNIFHLIRTGATLQRTGAMGVLLDVWKAPFALRLAARALAWPFQWLGYHGDASLPPATRALAAMGPAYIKFGQILSTRPDVVGDDLAVQLRVLQDRLPPFARDEAIRVIAAELDCPADQIFKDISEPVAAASIAQVHRARLVETGQDVAIKVLRPGIERRFRRDIDAFYFIAWVVEKLAPGAKRLRPQEVIAHFESVVTAELDLRLEAASGSEFAENTIGDAGFRLPAIHWAHSARRVMTMDWVHGIAANDLAAIDGAGLNRQQAGERVLQLFLSHALRDGLFHADMHHGNVKIALNGDIIALDFGIMGRIDDYTRRVYAEILYGFIRRDYQRVAEVHFEAGYVPADRNVDEFARALRAVGEPIFGMDATQMSMGRLLSYLFEVTERFGMQTRTELILLQRTMVVVEGVARSLHPGINIWKVARPIVERYIRDSIGPKALAADLMRTARVLARFGPLLPQLAEQALIRYNSTAPTPAPYTRFSKGWIFIALLTGIALGFAAAHLF